MRRESRAVLFDLDDTIYPQRRFVLSGLAAVARELAASHQAPERATFRLLVRAMRGPDRGRELQACLQALGLSPLLLQSLVGVMRAHRPALRLPRESSRMLEALRATWRVGVVTNGHPAVQARKVTALGLQPYVDTVVYAVEHGSGLGKPDVVPFHTALTRLGVASDRALFVGDSEACDILGAARAGLRTLLLRRPGAAQRDTASAADAVVRRLAEVPRVAERLMREERGGVSRQSRVVSCESWVTSR